MPLKRATRRRTNRPLNLPAPRVAAESRRRTRLDAHRQQRVVSAPPLRAFSVSLNAHLAEDVHYGSGGFRRQLKRAAAGLDIGSAARTMAQQLKQLPPLDYERPLRPWRRRDVFERLQLPRKARSVAVLKADTLVLSTYSSATPLFC